MHHLTLLTTLAFSLTVPVSSLVVPRATPPKGWLADRLEPYDTYHTRYMALSCNSKHSTPFFDQCCHPLLAGEKLSALPAQCTPTSVNTTVGSNGDDNDDDLPYCDDDGDDNTPPPATTPTPAAPKPTPTSTAARQQGTPVPAPAPAPAPPSGNSGSSSVETGGFATFFYQNGVAGACGTVHKDTDLIAAIDGDRYGNLGAKSSLCGKKVKITNPKNQKTVTVTIADACPTCKNGNSIDLSVSAFQNIATLDEGMVGITWQFV